MQALFSPDSKFMRGMSRLADLVTLNLLFLLTSIPVFTIGAAQTALYTVCFRFGTEREGGVFRSYFRAFRDNFKQATVLWLFLLLFGAAACVNILLFYSLDGIWHYAFLPFLFALVLVVLMAGYTFPLLSQFDNSCRSTLKNALIMGVAYFPRSVVVTAFNLLPAILFLLNVYVFFQSGFLWVFLYFSAAAYLSSFVLKPVFAPYISETDKEETQ